ncbi:phosphoenolpyruvate--protein phosphotransferase [uncultured Desulfovibrio sp.]|uniref:phosphoenolpyruvate--protein phosphotransferase n=1 Tax=uncultured Desulfovibrio sp. TaxID=167968 RepID=UPI0026185C45|nr:phosphoenolpyruvate--protein phosphotransferase [uncultured Desulfovibrio sp.]
MARALLYGTAVSPGYAIGRVHLLHVAGMIEKRRIAPRQAAREQQRLRAASEAVREALREAMGKVPEELAEYREVIAAQMELARDPKLLESAARKIESDLICASWALDETINQLCALFDKMEDPYLRDRAQDIRAVGLRLRESLQGAHAVVAPEEACVLMAEDLSPADVMDMDFSGVQALVTAQGGPTSHTAILARGLRIPALVGLPDVLATVHEGDSVIVDGVGGVLLAGPEHDDLAHYSTLREEYTAWETRVRAAAHWPADTRDGVRVRVQANMERPDEAAEMRESGADGVGLYRTEFSFLRDVLPGEKELLEEYGAVARGVAPARVVFRTLDVGADKMMRAQSNVREPNPALGLRGIRFCLRHRHIFRTQLRALMRVGVAGNVALMLPMISTLDEVLTVRDIMRDLHGELAARRIPHAESLPLGVMIETPAAVLIADALARECDFFSIGTNDLIHYLLAIDRNNHQVAYLNEALHPAVVRSLKRIIDAAHREGIWVSVCGELASDPYGLALLLGMGVDAVSASPRFVPGMKHMLRRLDAATCMDLAYNVLMSADISASQRMVRERLQESLGSELAFHTTSILTHSHE